MSLTLGIDLGGTKTDIALINKTGQILNRKLIKTSKEGPQVAVKDLLEAIAELTKTSEPVSAIGIGMAGQIDSQTGEVLFAPNLGWKNFPLGHNLYQDLRIPVYVTNDVRAAAWGEWLYGVGQGCQDLICLFIGTGIGSGIVSGGKMLTGGCNTAGEVGHMTLDLHGPLCKCGNRGCFEALASGSAIARRTKELVAADLMEGKRLLESLGCLVDEITTPKIFEAYERKSPIAVRVVEETKEALIAGVAGLINAFNPEKVILGGGVISGLPELVDVIRKGIPDRALKAPVDCVEVVLGKLKGDAGVIGAAAFAQQRRKDETNKS